MKKQIIALFAIILAVFFVTCEAELPVEEVEYTDVVYSEDGSRITLYLDGKGVPVTKSQRAITTDLAKMAYDYFEVIFISPSSAVVARANWELGNPAGITGVARGTAATGIDYKYLAAASTSAGTACMFVGRKDNKTLLGVGRILDVDQQATAWVAGIPSAPTAGGIFTVFPDSTSVTFYIEAIKTGLLVVGEDEDVTGDGSDNMYNIKTSSFDIDDTDTLSTTKSTYVFAARSARELIGGLMYPVYSIPSKSDFNASTDTKSYATYSFQGAASSPALPGAIKLRADMTDSVIQKRFPRYNENGRYFQTKSAIDSDTTVKLDPDYTASNNADADEVFDPDVLLVFDTQGSGMFSFYLEIPVYMLSDVGATVANTGVASGSKGLTWRIRTGIGPELYCLDSGKSAGGCVLIKIGAASGSDWLDINWEWLP